MNLINYKFKNFSVITVTCFTIVFTLTICSLWLTNQHSTFLSLIQNGATMKFNTALLFLITSLTIFLTFLKKEKPKNILAIFLVVFSLATLIEYIFSLNLFIDNLFVQDSITINDYPGRMSPSTSFCFLLIGIATLYFNKIKISTRITLLIIIISAFVIGTYILSYPMNEKPYLIQSMSINTAVLFLLNSTTLLMLSNDTNLKNFILSKRSGSKILRLNLILLSMFFLSYLILSITYFTDKISLFNLYLFHSLTFVTITIILVIKLSKNLNIIDINSEIEKKILEEFKNALDKSAIVNITDKKGNIIYVNENFSRISGYSPEEILGKNKRMINSDHHDESFWGNMHNTISQGIVWKNKIKNIRKNGETYWVQSTIIPLMNAKGKITKYIDIEKDITEQHEEEISINKDYLVNEEKKKQILSENLHEDISQIFIGANFKLKSLIKNIDNEKDLKTLYEISDSLSQGMKKTNNLSFNVFPRILNDFGLYSAIKSKILKEDNNRVTLINKSNCDIKSKSNDAFYYNFICKIIDYFNLNSSIQIDFSDYESNKIKFIIIQDKIIDSSSFLMKIKGKVDSVGGNLFYKIEGKNLSINLSF